MKTTYLVAEEPESETEPTQPGSQETPDIDNIAAELRGIFQRINSTGYIIPEFQLNKAPISQNKNVFNLDICLVYDTTNDARKYYNIITRNLLKYMPKKYWIMINTIQTYKPQNSRTHLTP